jgi:hypothetical protein
MLVVILVMAMVSVGVGLGVSVGAVVGVGAGGGVQEMVSKAGELPADICWHFIGMYAFLH